MGNSKSKKKDSSTVAKAQTTAPVVRPKATQYRHTNIMFSQRKKLALGKVPINVCILKGDLTTEKVDVVVCTSNRKLDLTKGRASKVILDAAGDDLQDDCERSYPDGIDYDTVAVVDSGNMPCKKVFFVALPVWGTGSSEQQTLETIISECLSEACRMGLASLSIPALGTGLLKYPMDLVAQSTMQAVENFSNNNPTTSVRYVNIVIYHRDDNVFSAFEKEARSRATGSGGASGGASANPGKHRGASRASHQKVGIGSIMRGINFNGAPKADCIGSIQILIHVGKLAESQTNVIVNNMGTDLKMDNGGLAQSLLEVAGQEIQDNLKENYPSGIRNGDVAVTDGYGLGCHLVYHGALPKWDNKGMSARKTLCRFVCKCLKMAEDDNHRSIAFPALGTGSMNFPAQESAKQMFKCISKHVASNPSSNMHQLHIVVYDGDKNKNQVKKAFERELKSLLESQAHEDSDTDESAMTFQYLLLESAAKHSLDRSLAPPRGTADWFKHLYKTDPRPPSSWSMFPDRRTLKEWSLETHGSSFEKIPVDSATFTVINDLVQTTWQRDCVGKGRDASGLDNLNYSNITVQKVERIENCSLFLHYAHQRQALFKKGIKRGVLTPLENLPHSSGPIHTTQALPSDCTLTKDLYTEINEHYMFHGTQASVVDTIMKQGLDCRLAGSGAMFGQGVYAAESSTKSDQYADAKDQRSSNDKKMFLVRMCLGEMYVLQNAKSLARPPCKSCKADKCHCTDNEFFDSVIGDGSWIFREFVVYDRSLVYPEYLITYTRN